jgi:hypothetical protein
MQIIDSTQKEEIQNARIAIIQNPKPWGVCVWFARIYL